MQHTHMHEHRTFSPLPVFGAYICIERERELERVPHYAELFGAKSAGRFLGEEGSAGDCDRAAIRPDPSGAANRRKPESARCAPRVGDFMWGSDIINNPAIRLWNDLIVFYLFYYTKMKALLFVFHVFV